MFKFLVVYIKKGVFRNMNHRSTWSSTWIFTYNVTLPQVFFKHFASKNQTDFYIIRTLVENG